MCVELIVAEALSLSERGGPAGHLLASPHLGPRRIPGFWQSVAEKKEGTMTPQWGSCVSGSGKHHALRF